MSSDWDKELARHDKSRTSVAGDGLNDSFTSSDWDKELALHDKSRTAGDDLRDSFHALFKGAKIAISCIPDRPVSDDEQDGLRYGPEGFGYYQDGIKVY